MHRPSSAWRRGVSFSFPLWFLGTVNAQNRGGKDRDAGRRTRIYPHQPAGTSSQRSKERVDKAWRLVPDVRAVRVETSDRTGTEDGAVRGILSADKSEPERGCCAIRTLFTKVHAPHAQLPPPPASFSASPRLDPVRVPRLMSPAAVTVAAGPVLALALVFLAVPALRSAA